MYYVLVGDYIYKYEVLYDKSLIENIRKDLILKCSKIIHKEEIKNNSFSFKQENIINVVRIKDVSLDSSLYGYDLLIYPSSVYLVSNFLRGDMNAISKIFSYVSSPISLYFDSLLDDAYKNLEVIKDSKDTYLMREQLEDIKYLEELKRLNSNQEDESVYIEKIKSAISFKFIDGLSKKELIKCLTFFNSSDIIDMEAIVKNLNRVRK